MNRIDGPVFIAVSKPLLTEFSINHRFEANQHIFREKLVKSYTIEFVAMVIPGVLR